MYGIIKVDVSLDGYVHWDGENELLDTENHEFEFDFKFNDKRRAIFRFRNIAKIDRTVLGMGHISYM